MFDKNGEDVKQCFMNMENGKYKNGVIPKTKHPNFLSSVMMGKKGWGLWVDQWSDGISECTFTLDEILNEFEIRNIEIPSSLLEDFKNRIEKKKKIKFEKELERLHSGGMWV